MVTSCRYMGQALTAMGDDWAVIVYILWKAIRIWERLLWILGSEGEYTRTLGSLYLEMVQSIMLSGSEMWAMNPHIRKTLGGFHHWVARQI